MQRREMRAQGAKEARGVTLVELYAWLLEQRLFWLDQVPETLVRALLKRRLPK